jgi:GMP synthase-like glutamine amidotransferase
MTKRLAFLDCAVSISHGNLSENDYGRRTIVPLARRHGVELTRTHLLDEPGVRKLKQEALRAGAAVINGSMLSPVPSCDHFDGIPTGATVLEFIEFCAKNNLALFGICYGFQMIGRVVGENVVRLSQSQFGFEKIRLTEEGSRHPLFLGVPQEHMAIKHHMFAVVSSRHVTPLATSEHCIEALQIPGTRILGVQFHPDYHDQDLELGRADLGWAYNGTREFVDMWIGEAEARRRIAHATPADYEKNLSPLLNFFSMLEDRK